MAKGTTEWLVPDWPLRVELSYILFETMSLTYKKVTVTQRKQ